MFHMHDKKTKRIVSGVIIVILVLAMVVPMFMAALSF